ncbi:hypothetical protein [Caldibacillus debilis]|nr:hypothetical protein [Caldibacillus debilis]
MINDRSPLKGEPSESAAGKKANPMKKRVTPLLNDSQEKQHNQKGVIPHGGVTRMNKVITASQILNRLSRSFGEKLQEVFSTVLKSLMEDMNQQIRRETRKER